MIARLPLPDAPRFSVIVPAWCAEKTLGALLEALARSPSRDFEVVVVSDASPDRTDAVAEGWGARLLRMPRRGGPGAARNAGARQARGEWLVFMDADVIPGEQTLVQLERVLRDHPEIECFTGVYSRVPAVDGLFQRYRALVNHEYVAGRPAVSQTRLFVTAIAGVKRRLFMEVGGFGTGEEARDAEDTVFGYRLGQRAPLYLLTEVVVRHHFPSFTHNLRLYERRAAAWTRLFGRRRRFDDQTTTGGRALSAVIGGGVVVGLAATPLLGIGAALGGPELAHTSLGVSAALALVYLTLRRGLFRLAARHMAPQELPLILGLELALAAAAALGACRGVLSWLRGSDRLEEGHV